MYRYCCLYQEQVCIVVVFAQFNRNCFTNTKSKRDHDCIIILKLCNLDGPRCSLHL